MGPCHNCSKRVLGCHSNCKDYIDWKKKITAVNERRKFIERSTYYVRQRKHRKGDGIIYGRSKTFDEL